MHLIGDSAYPLLRNLMRPIRDNGNLSRRNITYNFKLGFIRLKYLDIAGFNLGYKIIAGACVMHDFINIHEGTDIQDEGYNSD